MIPALAPLRIRFEPRIPDAQLTAQLAAALQRRIPRLQPAPARPEPLLICGGGPSLARDLGQIAALAAAGARILAINEVPEYLRRQGIHPWAAIHLGPVELTTACIGTPIPGVTYFVASICPASSFDRLEQDGARTVMWHPETGTPEADALLAREDSPTISGGFTAGLRALGVGWQIGFRQFHLFGLDSSTRLNGLHIYSSVSDGVEEHRMPVFCDGDWHDTIPELAGQTQEFIPLFATFRARGAGISVHGDGLLPAVAAHLTGGRTAPERLVASSGPHATVAALRF
ncbi:6-hydroxymethylpterin diphosphokinase MptE-like protein [Ferrovibrio sp.]|uniref:6-hydroxymethylpterin diphosphokinase MptE-like protein n=1 Tax=Ferrovibrio sp. TaxID=1917215 RepID=UPI003511029D